MGLLVNQVVWVLNFTRRDPLTGRSRQENEQAAVKTALSCPGTATEPPAPRRQAHLMRSATALRTGGLYGLKLHRSKEVALLSVPPHRPRACRVLAAWSVERAVWERSGPRGSGWTCGSELKPVKLPNKEDGQRKCFIHAHIEPQARSLSGRSRMRGF